MDDSEIVKLFWHRDPNALSEISAKYESYCTCIANNILHNNEDAEECVNDTYIQAWNSIPPNQPKSLSAFLAKITRNLAINKYKHNMAEKRRASQFTLALDELSEMLSTEDEIHKELDKKELIKTIEAFLYDLPESKRNIFIRRYWFFDSIAVIAGKAGLSENNVSVILKRQRDKLRKYLKERGFDV